MPSDPEGDTFSFFCAGKGEVCGEGGGRESCERFIVYRDCRIRKLSSGKILVKVVEIWT